MPYSYDEQAKDMLDRFIAQLNTSCEKADPDEASADLKYTRALQRNRLLKTGVTMSVDYSHDYHKMIHGIAWKMDVDTRYVTRIPFHAVNAKISYFLNGKLKKKINEEQNLYAYSIWLKGQTDANYVCPHCGAATRVSRLTDGCEYCGTRFLLHELFPKITNFYTLKSYSYHRNIAPFTVAGAILTPLIAFLVNYGEISQAFQTEDFVSAFRLLFSLIVSVGVGAVLGYILFAVVTVSSVLWKAITSIPAIARYNKVKRILPGFMRGFEPNFSLDYFIGKLVSLTSTLIYSDKADNLSIYEGESPAASLPDVVDAEWLGYLAMNKSYEQDGLLYLDMDIHMNCMHFENGKFSSKDHVFNLLLSKRAEAKTDYDFNVQAVNCNSCGASFDALREKHCPNCNTPFRMTDYDWTVKRFVSL